MNVIAIDPGKNGGICYAGGDVLEASPLPYDGKEIDWLSIERWVAKHAMPGDAFVFCEVPLQLPGRSSGAKTSFTNFGRIKQLFIQLGFPFVEVSASWAKTLPKDKADRIRMVRETRPWLGIEKYTKLHQEGIADAVLLAAYVHKEELWKGK